MKTDLPCLLIINGCSSSIKFAFYQVEEPLKRRLYGKVDRIGLNGTNLTFHDPDGKPHASLSLTVPDHQSVANILTDWLEKQNGFGSAFVVGHRVVHGMEHTAPELVSQEFLDELHRIRPYAPEPLPRELELIEAFSKRYPIWRSCPVNH